MQIGILIQNVSKSYVIFHAMATSPKLIFNLITKNRPLLVLMHFHTISSRDLPHSLTTSGERMDLPLTSVTPLSNIDTL